MKDPIVSNCVKHNMDIHLAELTAVRMMIEDVLLFCLNNKEQVPELFVIAIDSQVALGMLRRRYTKLSEYQGELKRILGLLENSRLAIVYVDTKMNPSDEPSRNDPFVLAKWEKVLLELKKTGEI